MSVSGTSLDSDKPATILCVIERDYWCCPIRKNKFESIRLCLLADNSLMHSMSQKIKKIPTNSLRY